MDDKQIKKLLALADMLILTAQGLTSRQSEAEISLANEMIPLADWVIKTAGVISCDPVTKLKELNKKKENNND